MDTLLYPFKFLPLYKQKVWGGNRIKTLGFDYSPLPNCGELWALSGMEGNESVVENGFLAGNHINEILEIYMSEIIGEKNFDRFGTQFPLLIKLIDAADKLSIQVHPDDALAQRRGMENGKTEMWYIIDSGQSSGIVDGFEVEVTPDEYKQYLESGKLEHILHVEPTQPGDTFFIPAGRIHAIGKDILLAEIQQSSDCTYRIYDYNRPDANGKLRELHTDEALEAIDFTPTSDGKTHYSYRENTTASLVQCPYFTTNLLAVTKPLRKDFSSLDSFVIYFCVEGVAAINAMGSIVPIHAGECVLVPAIADTLELFSATKAKLLEVYIDPEQWKGESPGHSHDNDWLAQFKSLG